MAKRVIYKYPLLITDLQSVYLPIGAKILSIQEQHGQLSMWAMISPGMVSENVVFQILGTGNETQISERAKHVGTVQMSNGLVWHVFKEVN